MALNQVDGIVEELILVGMKEDTVLIILVQIFSLIKIFILMVIKKMTLMQQSVYNKNSSNLILLIFLSKFYKQIFNKIKLIQINIGHRLDFHLLHPKMMCLVQKIHKDVKRISKENSDLAANELVSLVVRNHIMK